jgi:hypothetical protein
MAVSVADGVPLDISGYRASIADCDVPVKSLAGVDAATLWEEAKVIPAAGLLLFNDHRSTARESFGKG